jgi:hypothetical protein
VSLTATAPFCKVRKPLSHRHVLDRVSEKHSCEQILWMDSPGLDDETILVLRVRSSPPVLTSIRSVISG